MLEAALIDKCSDPFMKPAMVEAFVRAVGNGNPLSVRVKSGRRLILVPRPATADEALELARKHVGNAVVRVGLTQYPADGGVKHASEMARLFDPCDNLRMGTAMFAKILRIVAKWYGSNATSAALPYIFDDAIHAWKTGEFEGTAVFLADDPGAVRAPTVTGGDIDTRADGTLGPAENPPPPVEVNDAGMRVNLSRIGSD